jgi:hypothetical protein
MTMARISTLIILLLTFGKVFSQNPSFIYFKGLGRTLMDVDHLKESSNYLKGDTGVSQRRDMNGEFIFDLGVHVEPSDQLRAKAIMRLSNPFGNFYGNGSAFNFREASIEGILAKKFYYNVGDIDLKMTQYTLYNFNDSWHEYESNVFGDRRKIMQYENFNKGNTWRTQGLNMKTNWRFPKWADSLALSAFGVRNKYNYIGPDSNDRLLIGSQLNLVGTKWIDAGARIVHHFDVVGTSTSKSQNYRNTVYSTDIALKWQNDKLDVRLSAEGGKSDYYKENKTLKKSYTTQDSYFESALKIQLKKSGVYVKGLYRNVGAEFFSAAAQTRRINDFGSTPLFAKGQNDTIARPQTLMDRIQNPFLYNTNIREGLGNYFVPYNIINPYGSATPNRAGFVATIGIVSPDSLLNAKVEYQIMSEVTGMGVSEKRKFTGLTAGASFMANKLFDWQKHIVLNAGYQTNQVTRGGNATVNLTANTLDLGFDIEFAEQLDFLVGWKQFNAKGNEIIETRDAFNVITSGYRTVKYDWKENIMAVGAKYRLSPISYMALNYLMPSFGNGLNDNYNYKYSQLFFNLTLGF